MHTNNRRPAEPPLTGYTRSTSDRRRLRLHWPSIISALSVLGIATVAVGYVWLTEGRAAGRAADRAAVVSATLKPTAVPGVPVRAKTPEYSPRLSASMGDGTWLLGKEIKRGLYAAPGGTACYWERLSDLSGDPDGTIDVGFARRGPQKVQLGDRDFAFTSNGCGQWVMVP